MLPPWADRIFSRLAELAPDKNQVGLARACGVVKVSVSNWKGKGTATKMISGDNLVSAAAYLETTAEWIMTGRHPGVSQLARFEPETMRIALEVLEKSEGEMTVANLTRVYEALVDQTVVTDGSGSNQRKVVGRGADPERNTRVVKHIGRPSGKGKA